MHRCKLHEIISANDLELLSKLMRVEKTHFRNQSFINQKIISVERIQLVCVRGKTFWGHVSSDKHLWFAPKKDVLLKLFNKVILVLEEVSSQKLLNVWPFFPDVKLNKEAQNQEKIFDIIDLVCKSRVNRVQKRKNSLFPGNAISELHKILQNYQ